MEHPLWYEKVFKYDSTNKIALHHKLKYAAHNSHEADYSIEASDNFIKSLRFIRLYLRPQFLRLLSYLACHAVA